jgi:hypothetical protein
MIPGWNGGATMFDYDDRDTSDHLVLEARRSASPSSTGPRAERPKVPTANAPVGLLERPEQPTVE